WWLVCRGEIHKFRCVPHLTGRRFEHGVTDCYTLFRDAYHLNRPGFPGECFICELRLPDHRFRWKHNKLFLLLPE
ncbi:hypothetical protein ACKWNG_30305, partial [Escherichia coli]